MPKAGGQESGGDGGINLDVLILGAGPPRGMKIQGPLSLFSLPGGETVLSRQVRLVRATYPEARVVYVGGFECLEVFGKLPKGVLAVENELFDDYAIGRSLEIGLRCCVQQKLLLLYGDLVFTEALLDGIPKMGSTVVLGEAQGRDVGVNEGKGKVRLFHYGIETPKWVQVAFLQGEELKLFKGLAPSYRDKLVHELLNKIIKEGGHLQTHHTSGPLWEIDCMADFEQVKADLAAKPPAKGKK